MRKNLKLRKNISIGILFAFFGQGLSLPQAQAQDFRLPAPGVMVHLSPVFNPPILKGIKVHPDNPFRFDFILDTGDDVSLRGAQATKQSFIKEESTKLIKYFLASLTIPEKDLWVNLSPYEKDRIIPNSFGLTEMGRDLLAEDYMLKQITASLIYPEDKIGKKFWSHIYKEAAKKFGTTNVPMDTFNKVWIVPEKAVVYENTKAGTAYIVKSKLKVMLEQDYLSLTKHEGVQSWHAQSKNTNQLGSQVVREIVLPELTKEVNEDKNFVRLRQIYNSLILATWYKKKIKDSILEQVYADKNKVAGINIDDPKEKERIYLKYLRAFKKGVFNYIREDVDPVTQIAMPKKYFSGGLIFGGKTMDAAMVITNSMPSTDARNTVILGVRLRQADNLKTTYDAAELAEVLRDHFSLNDKMIAWDKVGMFYNMHTPWRNEKRQPAKPFTSVRTPFSNTGFHFIKQTEPSDWNFNDKEIFWEGDFSGNEISLVEQKWPFALKHFLILPQRLSRRAQILDLKDIRLALQLIKAAPFVGFRIGFNSLAAGASVNHLHMHGFLAPENTSAVEKALDATSEHFYEEHGCEVSILESYPARVIYFSGNNLNVLSDLAAQFVHFLQKMEIAHSVVFTPKGIFVFPLKKNYQSSFGNTWTFYELMGFIANPNSATLNEEQLRNELGRVTIDSIDFQRLLYLYKAEMAINRTAKRNNWAYDMELGSTVTWKVAQISEVLKTIPHDRVKFMTGYNVSRRFLGGIMSPVQGVRINDEGEFVMDDEHPDYVIQKMVLGDNLKTQIEEFLQQRNPDVLAFMKIYEALISYYVALFRRGVMDLDKENYLGNLRGEGKIGYDISHIRDIFSGINIWGSQGYSEDFEENFNIHMAGISKRSAVLGAALSKRFGNFTWKAEFERRGIKIPESPNERQGAVPMLPWIPELVVSSMTDAAMTGFTGQQRGAENAKGHDTALEANKGGIDFTLTKMNLQTQNDGDEIKLHFDPAMLQQLQNAPGFVPVIIDIQPLRDLGGFLGIKKDIITAVVT